jgi:hypothetical protein
MTKQEKFLTFFPDCTYRYLDQTGDSRPPISSAVKRDELNLNKYESYFTVNGFRNAPNAQKENCSSINAFFVDIDGRKDMDELTDIRKMLDPTIIVETGRGHHLYWVLEKPIYKEGLSQTEWNNLVAQWEQIEQSLVTKLKGDPVVKDLPRILRLPDTIYWKKTKGEFKIKIIFQEPKNVYKIEDVEKVFRQLVLWQ